MAKFLIVGLGNIGPEYQNTRHNIGFMIVDAFAQSVNAEWQDKRYGFVAKCRVKSAEMVLLKPSTYMNLSGNAVRYWLQQEKIPVENMRFNVEVAAAGSMATGLMAEAGLGKVTLTWVTDEEDFAEEELERLGISKRYFNRDLDECCKEIEADIASLLERGA